MHLRSRINPRNLQSSRSYGPRRSSGPKPKPSKLSKTNSKAAVSNLYANRDKCLQAKKTPFPMKPLLRKSGPLGIGKAVDAVLAGSITHLPVLMMLPDNSFHSSLIVSTKLNWLWNIHNGSPRRSGSKTENALRKVHPAAVIFISVCGKPEQNYE